jgi:sulfur carrier protein
MNIFINGQKIGLLENKELMKYLPAVEPDKPFAVAINGNFIPRSDYSTIQLKDGDEIDVVSPVGGG